MKEQNKARDMTPLEIRMALLKAYGGTGAQAAIARDLDISLSVVTRVIDGTAASDRVRKAIAEYSGKDVRAIWPSIYLYGNGPRKPGRPFSKELNRATA